MVGAKPHTIAHFRVLLMYSGIAGLLSLIRQIDYPKLASATDLPIQEARLCYSRFAHSTCKRNGLETLIIRTQTHHPDSIIKFTVTSQKTVKKFPIGPIMYFLIIRHVLSCLLPLK